MAPEPIQQPVKPWPDAPRPVIGTPPTTRTAAEAISQARIYGPMAAAALGRNAAAKAVEVKPANEDGPAAQPAPVAPAETIAYHPTPMQTSAVSFPPPQPAFVPAPQPAPQPAPLAPAAAAEPLVLTHPPESWPTAPAEPEVRAAPQAPTDPSLFQEGWAGGEPTRVVRHEATSSSTAKPGSIGPFILMAIIGLAAFAGAVAAFLRGRTQGDYNTYAWVLAAIGIVCVAVSVFFLLKRIGGDED